MPDLSQCNCQIKKPTYCHNLITQSQLDECSAKIETCEITPDQFTSGNIELISSDHLSRFDCSSCCNCSSSSSMLFNMNLLSFASIYNVTLLQLFSNRISYQPAIIGDIPDHDFLQNLACVNDDQPDVRAQLFIQECFKYYYIVINVWLIISS